jgi:hypothetical protein
MIRWVRHVGCAGEKQLESFVEKPEGNRLMGRSRCKSEDSIKMDVK